LPRPPDSVKLGARSADKWYLGNIFKDTSIGDLFTRSFASVANWPIAQSRLFNSRNRIVRGASNWITGQHVSNRVYSNDTNFMSIESIVEGSSRAALPFANYARSMRAKLGSSDFLPSSSIRALLYMMRQMNDLTGEIADDKIPDKLKAVYGDDLALPEG
jgi:hypothetical protein